MVQPFIILFLVASAIRTFVPEMAKAQDLIKSIAAPGFAGALFLIGAGLSPAALKSVGWRVLLQAVITWVLLAGLSLAAIMKWQT